MKVKGPMAYIVFSILILVCGCGEDTPLAAEPVPDRKGKELSWSWQEIDPGKPKISKVIRKTTVSDVWLKMEDGLPSYPVSAIAQLKNGAMIFATDKGMSVWHKGTVKTYTGWEFSGEQNKLIPGNSGLPGDRIQDLLVSKDGSLWVATNRGVCLINGNMWKCLKVPQPDEPTDFEHKVTVANFNDVQKLFETNDGRIILGSRRAGITVVDPKTDSVNTIYRNNEMNNWITGIAEDKDRNLWFGVYGLGVLRYNGKNFKLFKDDVAWIPDESISSLCIDHAGNIWVGTREAGLGVRFVNGQAKIYTKADILPSNFVEHLFVRKNGQVWVATIEGVASWDGKTWMYPVWGDWKGAWLQVCYEAVDGAFWIGGVGVVRNPIIKIKKENPY